MTLSSACRGAIAGALVCLCAVGCGSGSSSEPGASDGSSTDSAAANDARTAGDAPHGETGTLDGESGDAGSFDATAPNPGDARAEDGPNDGVAGDGGAGPDGLAPIERCGFCTTHWCWSTPLPQGSFIRRMWASPSGRVWACGAGGLLMTWDGTSFSHVDLGVLQVEGIWGSSDDDIWVSGNNLLWHFDGTAWKQDTSAALAGHALGAISGTGPHDVWIGSSIEASLGVSTSAVLHFDGSTWSEVQGIPETVVTLVAASSPGDVWFMGSSAASQTSALYEWSVTGFRLLSSTEQLQALWSGGPDDFWFVDQNGLERNDGTALAPVWQNLNMFGSVQPVVFGSGPDDVFAMDVSGLVHWNGSTWARVTLPETLVGNIVEPYAGASLSPNEAVVGGGYGQIWDVKNLAADGGTGTLLVPALLPGATWNLGAVWSDGAGTVFAAGNAFLRLSVAGTGPDEWTQVPINTDAGGVSTVTGLWGSSKNDVWAVGMAGDIAHYDGNEVAAVPSGLPAGNPGGIQWSAVAGASAHDVWAVGTLGAGSHYDGSKWTFGQTASVSDLTGVWVDPATHEAWACGHGGTLEHYTSATGWQRVPATPTVDFSAMWGSGAGDIWLGTASYGAYHYDGSTFVSRPLPDTAPLWNADVMTAIQGDGAGGVVAISGSGLAMRFDGSTWSWEPTGTDQNLYGLWLAGDGTGWVVGWGGVILRRR